jgi:hypothetical protein
VPISDREHALRQLTAAMQSGSADEIEDALVHTYEFGLSSEHAPILISLLGMATHTRHEDIVLGLQELRDPRAADALFEAALTNHKYLAFDEFHGLARKCTWALADIGTPDARAKLESLAQHQNPQIAQYARKRLVRWSEELQRKAAQ